MFVGILLVLVGVASFSFFNRNMLTSGLGGVLIFVGGIQMWKGCGLTEFSKAAAFEEACQIEKFGKYDENNFMARGFYPDWYKKLSAIDQDDSPLAKKDASLAKWGANDHCPQTLQKYFGRKDLSFLPKTK